MAQPSSTTSTSRILIPLSRSTSSQSSNSDNSLTSSETSFDPEQEHQERRPRILGLRELSALTIARRESESARNGIPLPGTPVSGGSQGPGFGNGGSAREGRRTPSPPPRILLLKAVSPGTGLGKGRPFAREVEIKGWKIVGGKSWSDKAKVGAYVVYDVEIALREAGSINILRRYTDFVKLRSALRARFPHLLQTIPKLPGKAHMSKFSTKFLAERQPRLQRFLRGVMLHPEMGVGGVDSIIGKWVVGDGGGS